MLWIIIIIIIGLIIFIKVMSSSGTTKNGVHNVNPVKPLQQIQAELKPFEENKIPIGIQILCDKESSFDDKSYLSPSEARKELKQRKDEGEWIEFDEYAGYMNAIYSDKDDNYIEKISGLTPEQVENWYRKRMEEGKWTTSAVFEAIADVLKPHHEEYLLTALDKVTRGRVEGWVNARKKEGYFFSDLAYAKANKILSGDIENRKTSTRKKSINPIL